MIASLRRFGRLGNRLFLFSNLIAFSEAMTVPLLVPAFREYGNQFPFFDGNPLCLYPPTTGGHRLISPFLLSVGARMGVIPTVRFWEERHVFFDGEDADDPRVRRMCDSPLVVFEGWNFRSKVAILTFRERIRAVFTPSERVQACVRKAISLLRKQADVVVGVHIRWEDYRNTARFFDLADYVERIGQIRALLAPSKTAFLVCSTEKLSQDALPPNCHPSGSESPVEDMYALAACDYIVGPPSTFSMWASYYGGVPLFVMRAGERLLDRSDARIASP